MEKLRIAIEPGKNYSNRSVKFKTGNVHEYEFFTDIVYKLMKIFENDDSVEIVDPSWARLYPTTKERITHLNNMREYTDLFISLRFADGSESDLNIPQCSIIPKKNNDVSLMKAGAFAHALSKKFVKGEEVQLVKNRNMQTVNGIEIPGFCVEFYEDTDVDYLHTQKFRAFFATILANAICGIISDSTHGYEMTVPDYVQLGETFAESTIIRSYPSEKATIRTVLPKNNIVEIMGFAEDDKWCKILYGGGFGYIDTTYVHVISSEYENAVHILTSNSKFVNTSIDTCTVLPLLAPIYNLETKKMQGVLFKGTPVRLHGFENDYAIIAGITGSLNLIRIKNLVLEPALKYDENTDTKEPVSITLGELKRRGYTHIII